MLNMTAIIQNEMLSLLNIYYLLYFSNNKINNYGLQKVIFKF